MICWLATIVVLLIGGTTGCAMADNLGNNMRPLVHDGDTIRMGATSWRLDGVDAPELNEPYGGASRVELMHIIDLDIVQCKWSGTMSYKRHVGICATVHYPDIGAELIRRGMALDCARYSHGRYASLEPSGVRDRILPKPYCN